MQCRWAVLVVLIALAAASADAAPTNTPIQEGYITVLNGQSQGQIDGEDTTPDGGDASAIEVQAYSHHIFRNVNLANGLPSGSLNHRPYTFVKERDVTSVRLYEALSDGETFIEIRIKFYQESDIGVVTPFFTVKLEDAYISSIRSWQPNANDPAAKYYVHAEEISVVYQDITWTHEDGSDTFMDSWSTPDP